MDKCKVELSRILRFFSMFLMVGLVLNHGGYNSLAKDVQTLVEERSKDEIIQKALKYQGLEYSNDEIYLSEPSTNAPYKPGQIQEAILMDGLNGLNYMRYLAGLPDDVVLDWALEEQQQAAALVNAANKALSHFPDQPSGMNNALYELGRKGTSQSNLAMGYSSFYKSIEGYMSDSDIYNIDRLGHRRWILNPTMEKTMFGYVDRYSSLYSFDRSRPSNEVTYDYVSWPSAGYFPSDQFALGDAWSVSLNPKMYNPSRTEDVKVTLTRLSDQESWIFEEGQEYDGQKYFNIETSGFGIPYCIIFRPDGLAQDFASNDYPEDESFEVKITGIVSDSGAKESIQFETTFFPIKPTKQYHPSRVKMSLGESLKLNVFETKSDDALQFTYSSMDEGVVTVDDAGVIRAVGIGEVPITISSYNYSSRVYVSVEPVSDGDQVSNWARDSYQKAKNNGIIRHEVDGNYQGPINRRDFTLMAVDICEIVLKKPLAYDYDVALPFEDVRYDTVVEKGYQNGLIKGTSATTFEPKNNITREQAALLIMNIYNRINSDIDSGQVVSAGVNNYSDDGLISGWARDAVYQASALNLLGGIGDNTFDPKGHLTYEQTYIIMQRIFDL